MAASTLTTVNFNNSSNANFRAWGLAMHNAILAGGFVDNGDSGQIDFATVLAPAAIDTSQGYKIYRSNDAGGGLDQFFIKLEFGSSAVLATRPAVWITAGFQGTDGAGNLLSTINPITTRQQIGTGTNPSGTSIPINMAAGSGYFCICGSLTTQEGLMFSVERTLDSALNFKNEILLLNTLVATGLIGNTQIVNKTNVYPAIQVTQNRSVSMTANGQTPIGGKVALGLIFGFNPGVSSPSLNVFGVESLALGNPQDTVTVPVLGANHDYKLQNTGITVAGIGGTVLLTRFE